MSGWRRRIQPYVVQVPPIRTHLLRVPSRYTHRTNSMVSEDRGGDHVEALYSIVAALRTRVVCFACLERTGAHPIKGTEASLGWNHSGYGHRLR